MTDKSGVTYQSGMHFMGELEGVQIPLDAKAAVGGQGLGAAPKGLVLTALAGCTAMDVISILKKMRVEPLSFAVDVEGDLTEEHPRVYSEIRLHYRFKGDVPLEKAQKAVDLSQERYCGVSAMLGKTAEIVSKIEIEA